jgi:hypothetical protein
MLVCCQQIPEKNLKKATKSDDNVKNKNSATILDNFSLLRQVSRGWRSSVARVIGAVNLNTRMGGSGRVEQMWAGRIRPG